MQEIMTANGSYGVLDGYFTRQRQNGVEKILLVCDGAIGFLKIDGYFGTLKEHLGIEVVRFSDFKPNPLYDSVENGVEIFNKEKCSLIAAVGGGSAIDVAKCIKLYCKMDRADGCYTEQAIIPNDVPLFAVPTTAGTGSEATRYAVIYKDGEKQSVTHESCIPSAVLFDSSVLKTLPIYQKKATMMDAFCHAVESWWSVNSTEESKEYSKSAIKEILDCKDSYLANDDDGNANMLAAANTSGKAINITQTTAGHAMCYKLTSLYGIAHGHAAALCVERLFWYITENTDRCIDSRGEEYLKSTLCEIAFAMGCSTPKEAAEKFSELVKELGLERPTIKNGEELKLLTRSVNVERLKNHPIKLDSEVIEMLYGEILK